MCNLFFYSSSCLYFLILIAQDNPPKTIITIHNIIVIVQPKLSFITAIPYADKALPIYVQEFKIPDIVETLPYFTNFAGKFPIKSKFIPCIQAVKKDIETIDKTMEFRFVTNIIHDTNAIIHIYDDNKISLEIFLFIYLVKATQIILKIGKIVVVNIDEVDGNLKVSLINVGIQVVIPSRSNPCKTIANIIGIKPVDTIILDIGKLFFI